MPRTRNAGRKQRPSGPVIRTAGPLGAGLRGVGQLRAQPGAFGAGHAGERGARCLPNVRRRARTRRARGGARPCATRRPGPRPAPAAPPPAEGRAPAVPVRGVAVARTAPATGSPASRQAAKSSQHPARSAPSSSRSSGGFAQRGGASPRPPRPPDPAATSPETAPPTAQPTAPTAPQPTTSHTGRSAGAATVGAGGCRHQLPPAVACRSVPAEGSPLPVRSIAAAMAGVAPFIAAPPGAGSAPSRRGPPRPARARSTSRRLAERAAPEHPDRVGAHQLAQRHTERRAAP